jgi:hypothetical protein
MLHLVEGSQKRWHLSCSLHEVATWKSAGDLSVTRSRITERFSICGACVMKLHSFNWTSLSGSWLSIVSGSLGCKFRPGHQQFYFQIIQVCAFIKKIHTRNQQMLKLYFSHNLS